MYLAIFRDQERGCVSLEGKKNLRINPIVV